MFSKLWFKLRRFRTWIFNIVISLGVFVPDLLSLLAGFDWSPIVPPKYLPLVGLTVAIVNILLRPRPAVIKEKAGS